MTPAEREAFHAELRERSRAAFASPEFRAAVDALKARCAAARVSRPARLSDEEFDARVERDEGGPDVVRNAYGSL